MTIPIIQYANMCVNFNRKGVVRDNTLQLSHTQLSLAGHPVKESVKCKEYA